MLKKHATGLVLLLFLQQSSAHTFDIGTFPVPGACVVSDYPNRAFLPWQGQKPNLILRDGLQKRSVLVLPSKFDDVQSPLEREALQRCVISSAKAMSPQDPERANTEDEENLARRINACLVGSRVRLDVRFATVKRETIQCPEGASPR